MGMKKGKLKSFVTCLLGGEMHLARSKKLNINWVSKVSEGTEHFNRRWGDLDSFMGLETWFFGKSVTVTTPMPRFAVFRTNRGRPNAWIFG